MFRIIPNNLEAQSLEIWEIQGEGVSSPYAFDIVTTEENIVTAKGNGFFFLQTPPERSDNNPLTSDGLLVNTGYPGQIGDVVSITGRVLETDGTTSISSSNIEITFISGGAPMPLPVGLGDSLPAAVPSLVHSLEHLENMVVEFSATATGPSSNLELTPLTTSPMRPFREPGVRYPGLPGLPVWDGNPEIFWLDPNGLNAPNNRFISAGAQIEATAILLEADQDFWLALPLSYSVNGSAVLRPVRDPGPGEFTVGSLNVLRLFANTASTNLRLQKLARYIGRQLRLPDVLALQEVGSLSVLRDLAYYIELEAPGTQYEAYLIPSGGEINLGFLIRAGIQNATVSQLGANEVFTLGGRLHDRPPLLLEAQLPTSPPTTIRVLNLHLRSLLGIEGPDADFVKAKRYQQSLSVANMAQSLQQEGNLIIVGDFNAYQFSDGYVDVTNQISGTPSLGAQYPVVSIVDPPLANQAELLPQQERYSYVFEGSAQILDQCLTSTLMEGIEVKGMQYGRGNADNALAYADNPFLAERASDHDGLVLFLQTENVMNTAGSLPGQEIEIRFPQPITANANIYLKKRNGGPLKNAELYSLQGQMIWRYSLFGQDANLHLPANLREGQVYLLRVTGERAERVVRVIVN